MANLDDMFRSAVPGGNIAKPLMIALLGLLALRRTVQGWRRSAESGNQGGGGLLEGLGGLVERFQQSGHGNAMNSWIGSGQNEHIRV